MMMVMVMKDCFRSRQIIDTKWKTIKFCPFTLGIAFHYMQITFFHSHVKLYRQLTGVITTAVSSTQEFTKVLFMKCTGKTSSSTETSQQRLIHRKFLLQKGNNNGIHFLLTKIFSGDNSPPSQQLIKWKGIYSRPEQLKGNEYKPFQSGSSKQNFQRILYSIIHQNLF